MSSHPVDSAEITETEIKLEPDDDGIFQQKNDIEKDKTLRTVHSDSIEIKEEFDGNHYSTEQNEIGANEKNVRNVEFETVTPIIGPQVIDSAREVVEVDKIQGNNWVYDQNVFILCKS